MFQQKSTPLNSHEELHAWFGEKVFDILQLAGGASPNFNWIWMSIQTCSWHPQIVTVEQNSLVKMMTLIVQNTQKCNGLSDGLS